jgi:hypothetical protein
VYGIEFTCEGYSMFTTVPSDTEGLVAFVRND